MNKTIIISIFLCSIFAAAQVKKAAVSSRINIGQPKARVLPGAIKEYNLHFKGFELQIYSDANDELGNHVLIGSVKIIEKEAAKRDPFINKSVNTSIGAYDDHNIILSTDKNYKAVNVIETFAAAEIKYDANLKKFIVGCDESNLEKIDGVYVSFWQPVVMILNEKLHGDTYLVESERSVRLMDFATEGNMIHIFAASTAKVNGTIKNEKLEIISIDPSKSHADQKRPWLKVLEPLSSSLTTYDDIGRIELSKISKIDSSYYFITSNLDQSAVANKNHIYKFENNKLEEQQDFEFAYPIHKDISWFVVNSFNVSSKNNYFFATNKAAERQIRLIKTNSSFQIQKSMQLDTFDYPDWNRTVELANGNSVTALKEKDKSWHYLIYNSDLEFVKEIVSQVPDTHYLQQFRIDSDGKAEAVYRDTGKTLEKTAIIQVIDLERN